MIKTSFLNPFSNDSKEIVSRLGNIDNLNSHNEELLNIIRHTPYQQIDADAKVPLSIKDLAIKRLEWNLFRKTDDFEEKRYEYLFNPEIYEFDVVSFYLLCQAVAIGYGADSHEAKLVIESQRDILSQRLEKIKAEPDLLRTTLNQLIDTNHVKWSSLKDILESGELDLNNLLLSNGRVIIEYEDFIEEYGHLIQHRDPSSMYQVTGGNNLKETILKSLIMVYTKQYIDLVAEKSKRMVEPDPLLLELSDDIKELEQNVQEMRYGGSGTANMEDNQPVNYNMEAFPPCVRKCLQGIKSGGRNDAIVLFLTPFISYSRLYPGIFSRETTVKISDVDPSLEITHNEVIPLIYEAAQACSPPLFKDQPQEKININSKLGFGMHNELKLEHEGETHWYTPMSCEKIKLHMSSLCVPSVDCKKIGNPLTYYNRKRRLMKRTEESQQVSDNGD